MDYYLSCCCLCGDHRLLIVFEMRSQMRRTFNIYHRGAPCIPLWLTLEVVPLGWNGSWPILLVLKTEEKNKFCKHLKLKEQRDAPANGCQNPSGFWLKALENKMRTGLSSTSLSSHKKTYRKLTHFSTQETCLSQEEKKSLTPSLSAEN